MSAQMVFAVLVFVARDIVKNVQRFNLSRFRAGYIDADDDIEPAI